MKLIHPFMIGALLLGTNAFAADDYQSTSGTSSTSDTGSTSDSSSRSTSDMGNTTGSRTTTDTGTTTGTRSMDDTRSTGESRTARESRAMRAIPHTTITFEAGSTNLTESDKSNLRKFVQEARNKGTVDQVTVAAWSDKALPRRGQKLSDKDRNLADRRAKAVSDYLKTEMEGGDIDTYNMAEPSNWLARTFNTKEAELKSVFGRRGAENPVTDIEYQTIKEEGGPSEVVVIAEMKHSPSNTMDNTKSHRGSDQ